MSIAHETVFPDLEGIDFPDEDRVYDIIDGRPVEKPYMGVEADLVAGELFHLIKGFAGGKLGLCFPGTTGYQIFADRPRLVRVPDVSFIRAERISAGSLRGGYLRVVPDLIAEVISTHDKALNVEERLNDFLAAGVPLAWLLYSNTRHVSVFHQGTPALRLGPGDILDGEDALPGFSCPVSDLFALLGPV